MGPVCGIVSAEDLHIKINFCNYYLMISHNHQCIFVHIPKTAGTSIEKKLGLFEEVDRGVQDHRSIREIEPLELNPVNIFDQKSNHYLYERTKFYVKKMVKKMPSDSVTYEQYRSYFKFTVVRNPWSRAVSWFRNVMVFEVHRKKFNVSEDCTFEQFITENPNNWALRPQTYWYLDRKGNNPMDFIGKFENLREDFEIIGNKIGLEDSQLPQLLKGNKYNYTQYYDNKLVDKVRTMYRDEIDFFNYEFGE